MTFKLALKPVMITVKKPVVIHPPSPPKVPVFCAPKGGFNWHPAPVKPVIPAKPVTPVKHAPPAKEVDKHPVKDVGKDKDDCRKSGIEDKKNALAEKLAAKKAALAEKLAALKAKCFTKHPVKDDDDHPDKDDDDQPVKDDEDDKDDDAIVDKDTYGVTFHVDETGDGAANAYIYIERPEGVDPATIDFDTYLEELKAKMAEDHPDLDPAEAVIKATIYGPEGESYYYFNGTEFEEVDDAQFYEDFAQDFGTIPDEAPEEETEEEFEEVV